MVRLLRNECMQIGSEKTFEIIACDILKSRMGNIVFWKFCVSDQEEVAAQSAVSCETEMKKKNNLFVRHPG